MSIIDDKIKLLPENPGVYVMLDKDGTIIYVGKAKNLKNRVRQYFYDGVKTEKVMAMVKNIADFYYIIVPSEIDALSLENNLIKKHKPRYNILLKDDKTYPYIRVDMKSVFPAFTVTRKIRRDGAKYFGPFMGGVNAYETLDLVNMLYDLRPCDKVLSPEKPIKPCLNYHIKKCTAPCALYESQSDYGARARFAAAFLAGDTADAEKILKEKMVAAAAEEKFELALKYKAGLNSLDKIKLKRITSLNKFISADVIAYRADGIYSVVSLLSVRGGRMLGGRNFSFESADLSAGEALSEFILRFYGKNADIPDEIISEREVEGEKTLSEYFKKEFDKTVRVFCAKQGVRKQLAEMAGVNAEEHLTTAVDRIKHKDDMTVKACETLREKLSLSRYPKRMECYDISHVSGTDRVGSMVVFIDGSPARDEYRRFKIKTFEGNDDFRSLQEVLSRRIERLDSNPEKFPKPDLIVIDGGKGQLSSVKEIFDGKGVRDIDLISLAKREEEIFLPDKSASVVLEKRDYCLKMLQRIRDEAHRFAITFHRSLRGKRALSSVLDGVKGLGKVKAAAVMERFKDISGIVSATKEELMQVEGVGGNIADEIIKKLTEERLK